MARCPGQDTQFWTPEDIYEVDCPNCKGKVEFWKDDVYRRCKKCNTRLRNPKLDLGCAAWCPHAKYCIGKDLAELAKTSPCATETGEVNKKTLLNSKPQRTPDKSG